MTWYFGPDSRRVSTMCRSIPWDLVARRNGNPDTEIPSASQVSYDNVYSRIRL